jgi:hypothetical protein
MRPAVARLVLFAVLFVGWLGYLGYLVLLGKPLVLSRPQFLVSQLDVIALSEGTGPVKVQDILYSLEGTEAARLKAKGEITVVNLTSCKVASPEGDPDADFGEQPKGQAYLMPLRPTAEGTYEVVPTPAGSRLVGPPRIYPATEQARAEYRRIRKPE